MKTPSILVPCVLLVASVSLTHATSIPIDNYSFLSADSSYNYDATQTSELDDLTAPPDWTVTPDGDGDVFGTANPVSSMYAGTGGSGSDGVLPGTGDGYTFDLMNFGSLGATTTYTYAGSSLGNFVIGQSYQLTLAIGLRADERGNGSPDYKIELLNNGSVIDSSSGLATLGTFTNLSLTVPFTDLSYTGAIGIAIVGTDNTGGFQQANFDNVRLVETPEPSAYAMLFGGLGMLVLISRFRSKLA
jgi:hypothetical protein